MSFKKLLIAVDESACAAHAADVGMDMARALGAEMAFVTVVDPSVAQLAPDSGVAGNQWIMMAQRDASNLLAAFHDRAATQPPALAFLERGKPASQILKVADTWPADLIIIGTHGRGSVGNILMGSVAQGVLHHARCPVLVIRAHA